MYELNLDLIDESLPQNKGKDFAIRIAHLDELLMLGEALNQRKYSRYNKWSKDVVALTWARYMRDNDVQRDGLAVSPALRKDQYCCNWCWPSYYYDQGYVVLDFDDLIVNDELGEVGSILTLFK